MSRFLSKPGRFNALIFPESALPFMSRVSRYGGRLSRPNSPSNWLYERISFSKDSGSSVSRNPPVKSLEEMSRISTFRGSLSIYALPQNLFLFRKIFSIFCGNIEKSTVPSSLHSDAHSFVSASGRSSGASAPDSAFRELSMT